MNFCSNCGATVKQRIPEGDTALRDVCDQCGTIHYINPKMVVGALAEWEGKILLCRRAIEPRRGMWTLPAGFMEMAETTAEAALRETREEACARVELIELYTLVNIAHIGQVHMFYRARLPEPVFAAGEESLEVALFDEASIPWDDIAFRSVSLALRQFFADRAKRDFHFRTYDLAPQTSF
ncbi:NUDIX hydrolase [Uliginosibacterium sp. H3]|uniref:NUDIX hydrolase n=1 Tax=Uliginosibacterium silvisoli TaxID=3114758 RepID=A0ABU6K5A5_9RHOO|nr:NUDIX hydrolase [Uliginosibacterium sp. H3]